MMSLKQKLLDMVLAAGLSALLSGAAHAGNGLVVVRPPVAPVNVTDTPELRAIMAKADALNGYGDVRTGRPLSWLEAVPGGHRIRYEGCDIYWSLPTGAHEVHGEIRAKYDAVGGPWAAGNLGIPTTDTRAAEDRVGRFNAFSGNAAIYWHPSTGAMVVQGSVMQYWKSTGGEVGRFGYPTTDEFAAAAGMRYTDFQNGVLYSDNGLAYELSPTGLSRAEMERVAARFFWLLCGRELLGDRPSAGIQSCQMQAVSQYYPGFWRSENRGIAFRIEGRVRPGLFSTPADHALNLWLHLHFFAERQADGSTHLKVYALLSELHALQPSLSARISAAVAPAAAAQTLTRLGAEYNLVSLKIMADGELRAYLGPNGDPREALAQKRAVLRFALMGLTADY